jgi:hypothetical protein
MKWLARSSIPDKVMRNFLFKAHIQNDSAVHPTFLHFI